MEQCTSLVVGAMMCICMRSTHSSGCATLLNIAMGARSCPCGAAKCPSSSVEVIAMRATATSCNKLAADTATLSVTAHAKGPSVATACHTNAPHRIHLSGFC